VAAVLALVKVHAVPVKVPATEPASASPYLVPARRSGLAKIEPAAIIQQENNTMIENREPLRLNNLVAAIRSVRLTNANRQSITRSGRLKSKNGARSKGNGSTTFQQRIGRRCYPTRKSERGSHDSTSRKP
jgi:hypothetical protein